MLSVVLAWQPNYIVIVYSVADYISTHLKACSNEANMSVQHHPTLLDATCWPRLNTMLEDVGLILNLLKIFIQHCATFEEHA